MIKLRKLLFCRSLLCVSLSLSMTQNPSWFCSYACSLSHLPCRFPFPLPPLFLTSSLSLSVSPYMPFFVFSLFVVFVSCFLCLLCVFSSSTYLFFVSLAFLVFFVLFVFSQDRQDHSIIHIVFFPDKNIQMYQKVGVARPSVQHH